MLVAETAPDGVELALGIVRDPHLGPLVVVGAGGVLVELMADRVVRLPHLDEARALAALAGLRMAPVLDGARGSPPVDRRPWPEPSWRCPSWPSSWATGWTPSTSIRCAAARRGVWPSTSWSRPVPDGPPVAL